MDPVTLAAAGQVAGKALPAAMEAANNPIYVHQFADGTELRITPGGVMAVTGGIALIVAGIAAYHVGLAVADFIADGTAPGWRATDKVAENIARAASKATGSKISKGDIYQLASVGLTGGLSLPFVGLYQAWKRW